mmetsp:Transcript_858/g.3896  ORF Transcript_858/g.3896 Transcript_858/m.3896 type:complete len:360 (+) Transcript_858:2553-3632(+)
MPVQLQHRDAVRVGGVGALRVQHRGLVVPLGQVHLRQSKRGGGEGFIHLHGGGVHRLGPVQLAVLVVQPGPLVRSLRAEPRGGELDRGRAADELVREVVHRGSVLLEHKVLGQRHVHRGMMRIRVERSAQQLQTPLHSRRVRLRGSLQLLLDVDIVVVAVEQAGWHGRELVELALRQAEERIRVLRLEVQSPLERQPGLFEVAELELARADTETHTRGRARVHAQRPSVPLKGVLDLIPLEKNDRLPEHGADVVLAAVLEGSRLVKQLLPIDRVPLCHLQMRSRDARHLLPVLPALVLPQQIRLIDQLLSLGEVLHAVDLVALALGDVDEVGRERAEDAAALVLRVGIILLDLVGRRVI